MPNVNLTNPGFETGDFTGWTQQNAAETAVVSTPVNSGAFAAHFTDAGVDTGGACFQVLPSSYSSGTLYSRCYFRFHSIAAAATDYPVMVLGSNSASPTGISARLDCPTTINVGRIYLYNSVTSTWSPTEGAVNVVIDTWYRMEMGVTISGGTGGSVELRLYDATNVLLDTLTWSGINTLSSAYQVIGLMNTGGGEGAGNRTFDFYLDDIAVNDSTWPGPISSATVLPQNIAVSADDQWLGGDYY